MGNQDFTDSMKSFAANYLRTAPVSRSALFLIPGTLSSQVMAYAVLALIPPLLLRLCGQCYRLQALAGFCAAMIFTPFLYPGVVFDLMQHCPLIVAGYILLLLPVGACYRHLPRLVPFHRVNTEEAS